MPSALVADRRRRRELRHASRRPSARTYETAAAATVVSTAGNATLSVTDPSTNRPGHLVNGAFSLAAAAAASARTNAANPSSAFAPLSETAGAPLTTC